MDSNFILGFIVGAFVVAGLAAIAWHSWREYRRGNVSQIEDAALLEEMLNEARIIFGPGAGESVEQLREYYNLKFNALHFRFESELPYAAALRELIVLHLRIKSLRADADARCAAARAVLRVNEDAVTAALDEIGARAFHALLYAAHTELPDDPILRSEFRLPNLPIMLDLESATV